MSSFIVLGTKGTIKQASLEDGDNTEEALKKYLKRTKAPCLIGSWTWQKYKLFLYGFKEGRAGTENKHEIPPPHAEVLLFGDACIVASLVKNQNKPSSFTTDQYKKFYNTKFGGFEDIDGDEDEEEEEEDAEDEAEDEDDEEIIDDEEEEEDSAEILAGDDEEEEEQRPVLKIKQSGGFKKIAKWMHSPELQEEAYPL
jgi:hypothetical protein